MNWYRNNWYYVGGILFALLAFIVGIFGPDMEPTRRIMFLFFMMMILHEFEEYVLPGGFPAALNLGMGGKDAIADRYPGNTQNCIVVNVFCVYPLFILGIVFHNFYPLGIMLVYFGWMQLYVHGILINKTLKTIYNPGMATIVFGFIPLGIYYLHYLAVNFNLPAWNWWVPIVVTPIVAFAMTVLPINAFKDKDTKYVFLERDVKDFSVKGKVARLRRYE